MGCPIGRGLSVLTCMNPRDLLATYAALAARFGVDSDEAIAFRNEHFGQAEFQSLARMVNFLLIALGKT